MKTVNFLSTNPHKVEEIEVLAKPFGIEIKQINKEKVEIQDNDPSAVAKTAASIAYGSLKIPLIVEDTGIFIEALNGFPGSYAAQCIKTIGLEGVMKLMEGVPNRNAYFKTAIAYADSGRTLVFEGIVQGGIAPDITEGRAFAFDKIFIPKGNDKTFSELGLAAKIKYSHRAIAFNKFAEYFSKEE